MNPLHPKAIEAAQLAKENAAARRTFREAVKRATAEQGLHFLVLGDHTICYKVDQHDVLQFSTAIRNRKMDKPIAEVGKFVALQRFESGATVLVRKARTKNPREWFNWMLA